MPFTHDTELSLLAAAALVDTRAQASDRGTDELSEGVQLEDYVCEHRFMGGRTYDKRGLEAVRAIRPRLRELWTAQSPLADRIGWRLHLRW